MAEFLDQPVKRETPVAIDRRAAAASEIARLAGKIALDYFERAEVSWKADDSMVTEADVAIQSWLEDEIAGAFPSDGILGEEGLTKDRLRPDAQFVWVIDPVDGTNNFGRGIPGFAISVGVLRDGLPFAGAVYDPVSSQLFTACVGHGAWLSGRPLRASPVGLSSRSLFSIRSPFSDRVPGYVSEWLRRYRLRRFGSTALQLCTWPPARWPSCTTIALCSGTSRGRPRSSPRRAGCSPPRTVRRCFRSTPTGTAGSRSHSLRAIRSATD
jgi:fructose-1,6-bisphosphatase/inositol monophosphatase family enzyme